MKQWDHLLRYHNLIVRYLDMRRGVFRLFFVRKTFLNIITILQPFIITHLVNWLLWIVWLNDKGLSTYGIFGHLNVFKLGIRSRIKTVPLSWKLKKGKKSIVCKMPSERGMLNSETHNPYIFFLHFFVCLFFMTHLITSFNSQHINSWEHPLVVNIVCNNKRHLETVSWYQICLVVVIVCQLNIIIGETQIQSCIIFKYIK